MKYFTFFLLLLTSSCATQKFTSPPASTKYQVDKDPRTRRIEPKPSHIR